MKATQKPMKSATRTASNGLTAAEKAAARERVREIRRASSGTADGESDVLSKIAEMTGLDRVMAERIHAIVKASAPEMTSRTWYGMPAYAKDGATICFFKPAQKFKSRYATLGFTDKANLDDGAMWPSEFALKEFNTDIEARIAVLLKQAIS